MHELPCVNSIDWWWLCNSVGNVFVVYTGHYLNESHARINGKSQAVLSNT